MNDSPREINKPPEQQLYTLLLQRDFPKLLDLCEKEKRLWRILRTTLYHSDEQLRWPAIEAVAKMMKRWWQAGHKEKVREYMRRHLWSLCDEAGEMGWSSPQTIAEIIISIPELIDPYGNIMISRSIEEPTQIAGGLWGIGRLGTNIREAIESQQDVILGIFETDDTEILGLAVWAMGEVGFKAALPYLKNLRNHTESIQIYIEGHFYRKPVEQWAEEAIDKINTKP
jgi:hypothetical protein